MKRIAKYLLLCFFVFIVAASTWSCSRNNKNPEESKSTEIEEKNMSTDFEEDVSKPSWQDEEYEKDEGFEKDDSEEQEFEPGGDTNLEDSSLE
jgi:hypothetical protein